jgi:hypothetical protein
VGRAGASQSLGSENKAALRELEKIDTFFSQYVEKFDETSIGWVRGSSSCKEKLRIVSILHAS